MACLDNIIKLSRTTCECFDANKPLDFNEGQSEIYLDELEGLSLDGLNGTENCEQGNLWELMQKARTNATLQFKADLLACIGNNFKNKRNNFSGVIGDTAFNATLPFSHEIMGLSLRPYEIVGGYFDLKKIGLMFNVTKTLTISIFSNKDFDNPIASYNMDTAANALQWVTLATPLRLPLWHNDYSILEYYIVYSTDGSILPKNNKTDCGCGRSVAVTFKNWMLVNGIRGHVGTHYANFQTTKEMQGLVIDGSFTCETSRLICSDEYPLDFTNDDRAMQMAYAVRFKAGQMLVQSILDSPNINRFTLLGREALYGKRNSYEKKYNDWISYLCENTEITNTDCLVCRPNPNFTKGSIIA